MDYLLLERNSNCRQDIIVKIENNPCCILGMVVTEINLMLVINISQPIQSISQHHQDIKEHPL